MSKQPQRLYVPRESFSGVVDGSPFTVTPQDMPISEENPWRKAYPDLFREYEPVEQSTSAPGERRIR